MVLLCIGGNHIFTSMKTQEENSQLRAQLTRSMTSLISTGKVNLACNPVFLICLSSFLLVFLIVRSPGECVQLLPWRGRLGPLVRRAHQLPGGPRHRADAVIIFVVVVVTDEHTNYQVVFATCC